MVGKVNDFNYDPHTRFLMLYTPQQIAGFERALEKARNDRDRYRLKIKNLDETVTGFENLLKEVKKDAK